MSQQDMMRPKSAMFYVDKTEQVAVDCLDHVEKRLDANGEFPGKDKFSYHFMNIFWSDAFVPEKNNFCNR